MDIVSGSALGGGKPRVLPDITVVIVTYNSAPFVADSISSALQDADLAGLTAEVIVVDNASSDGTADHIEDKFPDACLIRNVSNVGFGRANNQAFELAGAPYWLLLNPDAVIETGAIRILVDRLAQRDVVGAVAPSIRSPGAGAAESAGMMPGLRSYAGHFLFLNRLPARLVRGPWQGFARRPVDPGSVTQVDWASAAVLLLRAASVRAVGGFDPSIFLYGEDVELCGRIRAGGWVIELVSAARAGHAIAATQVGISTRWVDGLHRLHVRRGRVVVATLDLVMALGLGIRAAALTLAGPARRPHARRLRAAAVRALRLAARPGGSLD